MPEVLGPRKTSTMTRAHLLGLPWVSKNNFLSGVRELETENRNIHGGDQEIQPGEWNFRAREVGTVLRLLNNYRTSSDC